MRHCRRNGIVKPVERHVEVGLGPVKEPPAPPRVTLPRNLSATLRGLEDVELETLQREVAVEVKRRTSVKPAQTVAEVSPPQAVSPAKLGAAEVPTRLRGPRSEYMVGSGTNCHPRGERHIQESWTGPGRSALLRLGSCRRAGAGGGRG